MTDRFDEPLVKAQLAAGLAMGQGLGTRYFSEVDQEYFDDAAKLVVEAALPHLRAHFYREAADALEAKVELGGPLHLLQAASFLRSQEGK